MRAENLSHLTRHIGSVNVSVHSVHGEGGSDGVTCTSCLSWFGPNLCRPRPSHLLPEHLLPAGQGRCLHLLEHQKAAWKAHRKWCKLVQLHCPGGSCDVVFVGQCAGKELVQHPKLSPKVVLAAAKADAAKGWVGEKSIVLQKYSKAAEYAQGLDDTLDMAQIRSAWDDEVLVIKRRSFLLCLEYCVGTKPAFVVTCPEGKGGFTATDCVSAAMAAYKFCYKNECSPEKHARQAGIMLNRGFTNGPFQISMHDLGDLILHTLYVSGAWPADGLPADDDKEVAVLVTLGIDS